MKTLKYAQRGLSLIELMVSLAIGLVIIVASLAAYLNTQNTNRLADAQSRMNEDAQAALSILSREIRLAGNNPKQDNRIDDSSDPTKSSLRNPVYRPTPTDKKYTYPDFSSSSPLLGQAIKGCDGGFSNTSSAATIDDLTCSTSTTTSTYGLAITYEADSYNTVPTSTGKPTDCTGSSLTKTDAKVRGCETCSPVTPKTTDVSYYVADNRYYIATPKNNAAPSLYCRGNGNSSAAQPLVQNIDDMQITYGTLDPTRTTKKAVIAGYLTASEINTTAPLKDLSNDAERWMNVVAVRICLIVRSEEQIMPDSGSATYRNCDNILVTPKDRYLRKAFYTTVGVSNEIFH